MIEADFHREYQIDLCTYALSWRKFVNLLGALTPDSVFFSVLREEKKNKPVEDPNDIMNDIARQLGGRKG